MESSDKIPMRRRGTAILIIAIIIISGAFIFIVVPRAFLGRDLTERVAVIDSGIEENTFLDSRVVAQKSFINESYGYDSDDFTTTDSEPNGRKHGTHVASIVALEAPHAAIVNAKVINSRDIATSSAIVQAIHWSVSQNCTVINLSLGGSTSGNGELRETITWAFYQGVTIVAAVGNGGLNGISGSSIEIPAVYSEVIGVAALNENNEPFSFSGRGPIIDRGLKPDISAKGYYSAGSATFFGTSFAAPIVAAGAARIIRYCKENGWEWSPGMVKSALMKGAKFSSHEYWEVGAGILDVGSSLRFLDSSEKPNRLPLISYSFPSIAPFDFERWFVNTTARLSLPIYSSTNATFVMGIQGQVDNWVRGVRLFQIDQAGSIQIEIEPIAEEAIVDAEGRLIIDSEGYNHIEILIQFDASVPVAKVAFDTSHSSWSIDSIFGQFRTFYERVTSIGIGVEEIRVGDTITSNRLEEYDAVFVLDPCTWRFKERNGTFSPFDSIRYTSPEIAAYREYWEEGGSLMLIAGYNQSFDIEGANELFKAFNFTLNYDRIPGVTFFTNGIPSTEEIFDIQNHPVTQRVESFDFNGCTINMTGSSQALAWGTVQQVNPNGEVSEIIRPILAAGQSGNSRIIVSGSNFFLDNYALNGYYHSNDNSKLMLQSVFWIIGII